VAGTVAVAFEGVVVVGALLTPAGVGTRRVELGIGVVAGIPIGIIGTVLLQASQQYENGPAETGTNADASKFGHTPTHELWTTCRHRTHRIATSQR
jgi:hypothetical protein